MLNDSDLNIIIELQNNMPIRSLNGNITPRWIKYEESFKARKRQLSGNEIIQNEKLGINTTDRFYVNYNNLFNIEENERRIIYDGKVYNIKKIDNPHGLNEFLQIDTEFTNQPDTGISEFDL